MEKEIYVRWSKVLPSSGERPLRGIIRFVLDGDKFTFETISGSSIDTEALVGLLWHYPPLEDFRKAAVACRRKLQWAVKRYDGMSGCSTWYIQHLRKGRVCTSDPILHSSMYGKQNVDIECWIKDIYDLLWDLKSQGCYPNAFSDEVIDDPYGYIDITNDILEKRKEFKKTAHGPDEGFGCVDDPIKKDLEKAFIDYSNYTPTEEEKEIDDNGIRPVVPVSSKEDDEDEYI